MQNRRKHHGLNNLMQVRFYVKPSITFNYEIKVVCLIDIHYSVKHLGNFRFDLTDIRHCNIYGGNFLGSRELHFSIFAIRKCPQNNLNFPILDSWKEHNIKCRSLNKQERFTAFRQQKKWSFPGRFNDEIFRNGCKAVWNFKLLVLPSHILF